jgi:thiol-disulfide isomerase/thioredoxin
VDREEAEQNSTAASAAREKPSSKPSRGKGKQAAAAASSKGKSVAGPGTADKSETKDETEPEAKTIEAETKTAKAGKAKAKAGAADGAKSVITSLYSSAELKKAMGDSVAGAGADSKAGADSDDDAAASVSIVVYKTSWCGACKQIQPLFEKLATEHPEVAAFSVMIDGSSQTKKIGQTQGIGSYPVFDVYVGGERKERIMGVLAGLIKSAASSVLVQVLMRASWRRPLTSSVAVVARRSAVGEGGDWAVIVRPYCNEATNNGLINAS